MNYFSHAIKNVCMCLCMLMFSSFLLGVKGKMASHTDEDNQLLEAMERPIETIPVDCMDKIDAIRMVLYAGGDVNIQDRMGDTPVHVLLSIITQCADNEQLAGFIYNQYINEILYDYKPDLMLKNNDGETPLHIAVKTGNEEIIQDMVHRQSRSKFIADNEGKTPLDYAEDLGLSDDIMNLLR
jgi:ankyrin repeat protein